MSDALGSYQPFWAAESLLTFWIYVQRQERPNKSPAHVKSPFLAGPKLTATLDLYLSPLSPCTRFKIKEAGKLRQGGCPHLIIKFLLYVRRGFPGSTSGKKKKKKTLPKNSGDIRDAGSIPGSGSSPGEGHGKPLHGQRNHSITRSWTGLKRLSTHTFIRWLVTVLRSPSTQRQLKHENL